jgi:hypothetical protein
LKSKEKAMKAWTSGLFEVGCYEYVRLLSPAGVEHLVEYHGGGGKSGDGWTAFGEPIEWPLDGTWQFEKLRGDEWFQRTGIRQQYGEVHNRNPWYLPIRRNLETRAAIKLVQQLGVHHSEVGAYLMEGAARVAVADGHGLSHVHAQDFVRTVTWAVRKERQGEWPMEWSLLHDVMRDAVSAWGLHGEDPEGNFRRPINKEVITAEEVMHMIAVTRIPHLIACLRDAIEAERPVWWAEIEPYAEPIPAGESGQMTLGVK